MQAEPSQSHVVQSSPGCELGATILGAVDVVEDGGELAIFGSAVVNREVVEDPGTPIGMPMAVRAFKPAAAPRRSARLLPPPVSSRATFNCDFYSFM